MLTMRKICLLWLTLLTAGCGGRDAPEPVEGRGSESLPTRAVLETLSEDLSGESSPRSVDVNADEAAFGSEAEPTDSVLEPNAEPLESDALIALLESASRRAGSLYQRGETRTVFLMEGSFLGLAESTVRSDFEQWFEAPNKLRTETGSTVADDPETAALLKNSTKLGGTLKIKNGDSISHYYQGQNLYFETETKDPGTSQWSPEELAMMLPELVPELRRSFELSDAGRETVLGRDAQVIRALPKSMDRADESSPPAARYELRFWVAEDNGRVLRTAMSLSLVKPEDAESVLGSADVAYDRVATATVLGEIEQPEIEPGWFDFVPPPGAEQLPGGVGTDLGPLP